MSTSTRAQNPNQEPADSILYRLQTAPPDTNRINLLNSLTLYLNRMSEHDNVIKYSNEAVELAKKLDFEKGLITAYSRLAFSYTQKNNFEEALKYNFLLVNWQEAHHNLGKAGTAYYSIGNVYNQQGRFDDAIQFYHKARGYWNEVGNYDGVAMLDNDLASVYERLGRRDSAFTALNNGLNHWKKGDREFDSIWTCDVYGRIGNFFMSDGKLEEAKKYFTNAIAISEKINKAVAFITTNRDFGRLYSLQGNYAESLKYFMNALKMAQYKKYPSWQEDVNNDIGNLYLNQKNYSEALKHFETSLKYGEDLNEPANIAEISCNIGNVFLEQNLLDSAQWYYNKVKSIAEAINEPGISYLSNHCLGIYYSKQAEINEKKSKPELASANLKTAYSYQLKALQFAQKTNIKQHLAASKISLGSLIYKQQITNKSIEKKDLAEATKYLQDGLLLATDLNDKEFIKEAYSELYLAYKSMNDYKNAMYYADLYLQLSDSLMSDQTSKKIEQVRVQYESQKAVDEEKARQDQEKGQMQYLFSRKEDSIKFQQRLMSMQLMQQTLVSRQQEQDLELKQKTLDIANKEKQINSLALLKSQAELETEQSKGKEKEQQLTISENEKALQNNQLTLQQTQLNLKETEIKTQKRQLMFYIGGLVLMSLIFVFVYWNFKLRQRANAILAAEKLKTEKANAAHKMTELELQSLRAQLNPHFMFNSLNAIQELILREDNDNSHLYLSRFAELLRMLLDNANQPFIPLSKEIEFLKLYLSLENLRISDLQFSIDIDRELEYSKIKIPNMMLQPYIENAIWHGLSHKKGERKLVIRVSKKENLVAFEVQDNGVGRQKAEEMKSLYRKEHRSKGMELLSRRFNLLSREYGSEIKTNIKDLHENGNATGTLVEIAVPFTISELKPELA